MPFGRLRQHRHYLVIAVIALVFYLAFFHGRLYGEVNGSFISYGYVMKDAYSSGTLPFWSTQLSGGYPLAANPEVPLFGILNVMLFLFPVILAFGITTLLHLVIAGIGAGALVFALTHSRHGTVVGGLAYMFTGAVAYSAFTGTMPYLYPLAFLPWILLFTYRAAIGRVYWNAVLAAALLAYQIISGGTIYFLWSMLSAFLLLGGYAVFAVLGRNYKRFILLAVAGALIILFTTLFAAVKLLPALEFNEMTNRAEGVSYDDYIWSHTQITPGAFFPALFTYGYGIARTGIIVTVLALAGIALARRKKYSIFLAVLAAVSLLIEFNTLLTQLLYHLPGYGQTRQIYTALGMFSLAIALFAGIGWSRLAYRFSKKAIIVTTAIVLLVAAEVVFVGMTNSSDAPWERGFEEQLVQYELLNDVTGRLHLYGEDFVGLSLTKYAIPHGVRMLDWTTGNVWFNDYIQFTSVAGQQNSAKLWGMAGVSHVASKEPLDIPGLALVREFPACEQCDLRAAFLYSNELALPEAFTAAQNILVVGDAGRQVSYSVSLENSFNHASTAIIHAKALPQHLEPYDFILLVTDQLTAAEIERLRLHEESGGVVEPSVALGATQADYERFLTFVQQGGPSTIAPVSLFEPTRVELIAPSDGLLVVNEKYYAFGDWKATVNDENTETFQVNFIGTGVFANEGDVVRFRYTPTAFYKGLTIAIIAVLLALLIPRLLRKRMPVFF